jgi:hypothetical protein
MTKDEALKLALEYIETNAHERRHVRWAIKEALAQPEDYIASIIACRDALDAQPVPRRWVGLTEDEINACDPSEECWGLHKIARAIEAKLKEKNT